MIIVLFVVLVAILWLALAGFLGWMAWDCTSGGDWAIGAVMWICVALMLVAPLAMYRAGSDDPNANRLCLRGHQEWRTTSTPVLVGKVIVPTESTHKVWMCEAWDAR